MIRLSRRALSATRLFTKTHEWFDIEKNVATIGISKFAVKQLGEVVYVDLPSVGAKFTKSVPLATVESVKAVGEVYCPFNSATVQSVNDGLKAAVTDVNADPEGAGWLAKLQIDPKEVTTGFLDRKAYDELCKEGH